MGVEEGNAVSVAAMLHTCRDCGEQTNDVYWHEPTQPHKKLKDNPLCADCYEQRVRRYTRENYSGAPAADAQLTTEQ